jgi:hypothetical protein
MTVYGTKLKAVNDLTITLQRYPLKDASQTATPLIKVSAKDNTGNFQATAAVTVDPSLGAQAATATLADFQFVNNDSFRYVITASLAGTQDAGVQLTAIQVSFS